MNIVWTGLPWERRDGNRLALSVFITPRLTFSGGQTDGKLGDFPSVRHWPDTVNKLTFGVQFDGMPTPIPADHKPIDPKWWKKLFTDEMPVSAFPEPDHSQTIVFGFPVRRILDFIETLYQNLAETSPTELPQLGSLHQFLDPIRPAATIREFEKGIEAELREEVGGGKLRRALPPGYPIAGLSPLTSDLIQAHRFYYRPEQRQPRMPRDPAKVPKRPTIPKPDFHQVLGMLGDSPAILRLMGLIVDLEFDATGVPPTGTLRVVPSKIQPGVDLRPKTQYELTADRFLTPRRLSFPAKDGTLRLDAQKDVFEFYQVDVDGAALKLLDLSQNLSKLGALPAQTSPTPDQASVPALRTGGFTVAAIGRAVHLIDSLDDKATQNGDLKNDNVTLGLEDVLRGFRIDVLDVDAGQWFSLHRRVGEHRFLGVPGGGGPETLPDVVDEGYVKGSGASSARLDVSDPNDPNKKGSPDLYVHEAMFGWDGWSLAAPRPGKLIVEPGEGEGGSTIDRPQVKAETDLPLESAYRVEERTLPRLRFGHGYRLRARAVDLAGNSLAFTPKDLNDFTTPERTYRRYEPVVTPPVVRRHPDTEGESLERLVIRSDDGVTAKDYVKLASVKDATAGALYTYAAESERHIAPPKTSVQMAEQLGALEVAFGPTGDPAAVFRTASKEEGTFFDVTVIDIDTGKPTIDVASDVKMLKGGAPPPRGEVPADGDYVYRPGKQLVLPYLPDPLSVGAGFYGLPGHETSTVPFKFTTEPGAKGWPRLRPFRLVLVEQTGALPAVDLQDDAIVVALAKAEQVRVRLSSLLAAEDLDKLAIHDLLSNPAALKKIITDGQHWMLTPFRYLELVHAVQHPLADPVVKFTPDRDLGSTFTGFNGHIANHAKSSGRLDTWASWDEPVDRVGDPDAKPESDRIKGAAVAFGWDIRPDEDAADVNEPRRMSRHEFGDTKHRRVRYRVVATTRFRENFPPAITSVPANIERPGAEAELSIPNSARPAAPEVAYIIPTFGWEEEKIPKGLRRRRRGGGLRVYLRRPWWSSGDGEQLGVVLPPTPKRIGRRSIDRATMVPVTALAHATDIARRAAAGPVAARTMAGRAATSGRVTVGRATRERVGRPVAVLGMEVAGTLADPYVTKWGKDPTWATGDPRPIARIVDFPLATKQSQSGLSIAEVTGARVAVAGHEVAYDDGRGLWYCDIVMDPGATYFPFVRLALARFQPESVQDAHLSRIVLADFMQIAADRTASVVLDGGVATVTVSGLAPHNIVAERVFPIPHLTPVGVFLPNSRTVSVTLQKHRADIGGDLGWENEASEVALSDLKRARGVGVGVTWQGTLNVPADAVGKGSHRLLIREYEHFFTDFDPDEHRPISEVMPGKPIGTTRSRIVYADTFDL